MIGHLTANRAVLRNIFRLIRSYSAAEMERYFENPCRILKERKGRIKDYEDCNDRFGTDGYEYGETAAARRP
jgi:hypothetical protein